MARKRRHHRSVTPHREPNGRLSRAGETREFAPVLVRRLRDAAIESVRDAEWGSELGRLYLAAKIEPAQYAAGKRWAELADKYHRALAAPVPDPRSGLLQRIGHSHEPDPSSLAGEKLVKRDRETVARMREATVALMTAGAAAHAAVIVVCQRDNALVGELERAALFRGLQQLADHFGLTTRPRANGHRILTDR